MDKDVRYLRREMEALAARVARLEKTSNGFSSEPPGASAPGGEQHSALTGLQARGTDQPSTSQNTVTLAGSLTLPDDTPVAWQQSADTSGMLEADWSDQAAGLAALAHPVRLELLRHILSGTHATADLASLESLGTTGQLHHHLRQLVAAGWVRQSGRGSYEVPAARVVPLLSCVAAAQQ